MKLLVVNPNTTDAMTHKVVAQVMLLAGEGVEVRGVTAPFGNEVIATPESFATGAEAALAAWRGQVGWPDGILLACFGDPGLAALRALAAVPVAGMAEAAMREAVALGRPYAIVTAGVQWPAMLREVARQMGTDALLAEVIALDTTGLAVSRDPAAFVSSLQDALDRLWHAGIGTAILGGAGFAGLRGRLHYPGVLIDGLEAAVRALRA